MPIFDLIVGESVEKNENAKYLESEETEKSWIPCIEKTFFERIESFSNIQMEESDSSSTKNAFSVEESPLKT